MSGKRGFLDDYSVINSIVCQEKYIRRESNRILVNLFVNKDVFLKEDLQIGLKMTTILLEKNFQQILHRRR